MNVRKMNVLYMVLLGVCVLVNSGCGFGGFNSSGGAPTNKSEVDNSTKISGVVAKGLFNTGIVRLIGLKLDGTRVLMKETPIDVFGNYSARINAPGLTDGYTGVVLLEASGSYIDEATGKEMSVVKEAPLRTALPGVPRGEMTAVVSPLTELAVRKAEASLTAETVTVANNLVSELFKVDIVGKRPVQLSKNAFLMASQEQWDYSLALAAISQMVKEYETPLSGLLASLNFDLAGANFLSEEKAGQFKTALSNYLLSDRNETGVDINRTNLLNAGGATRTVKFITDGELPPEAVINGVEVTVKLPANVRLRADLADLQKVETFVWVVTPSKQIAGEDTGVVANYKPETGEVKIVLVKAFGFRLGEFAVMRCDVPAGMVLDASDFSLSDIVVSDPNGMPFAGVGVKVELE